MLKKLMLGDIRSTNQRLGQLKLDNEEKKKQVYAILLKVNN